MRNFLIHIYISSLLLFSWRANVFSQNLVPNWSFEEYNDSCTNPTDFENVKDWLPKIYLQGNINAIHTFGTPDYYSSCIPFFFNYPPILLANGFQYPHHLNSFIGIGVFQYPTKQEREAIRVKLKEPLKYNTCYHAEMFVNLHNDAGYVYNKLGMVLSIDSFPMIVTGSLPYPTPQVYTNTYIYDTLNWVKIGGDFTANGGEEWLTIGWMFDSTQIAFDSIPFGNGQKYTYYNIDAVKVHPCTDDEAAIKLPNLITPNGDGKNDLYLIDSLPPNSKASFFNRWGNQIYTTNNYQNEWDGTYMGHLLPAGTYFVVLEMPHGTRKSTFIELMY